MLKENVMIQFLKKFDACPFTIKMGKKEYQIGDGIPAFAVKFHKMIPLGDLSTSTSLALGEAYMDGNLEVEGSLYEALDLFLEIGRASCRERV